MIPETPSSVTIGNSTRERPIASAESLPGSPKMPITHGAMRMKSAVSAVRPSSISQKSVDATRQARFLSFSRRSVKTGTNADESAASATSARKRFGSWNATVNALILPPRRSSTTRSSRGRARARARAPWRGRRSRPRPRACGAAARRECRRAGRSSARPARARFSSDRGASPPRRLPTLSSRARSRSGRSISVDGSSRSAPVEARPRLVEIRRTAALPAPAVALEPSQVPLAVGVTHRPEHKERAGRSWTAATLCGPASAGISTPMPNIRQQEKRVRQASRQRIENLRWRSTAKTLMRRLRDAAEQGRRRDRDGKPSRARQLARQGRVARLAPQEHRRPPQGAGCPHRRGPARSSTK